MSFEGEDAEDVMEQEVPSDDEEEERQLEEDEGEELGGDDEADDDERDEEEEEDVGLRKRRSVRSETGVRAFVSLEEGESVLKTEAAYKYLSAVWGGFLVVYILLDILVLGLRGGSSGFVTWWDMVGTVAYVRSRNGFYALRRRPNQSSLAWALYLFVNSFIMYQGAGKAVRTIMRHQLVLPSAKAFLDFVVYGFLPVHFFPGDHFYELLELNELHKFVSLFFWAATKTRSVYSQMFEAVHVHGYTPLGLFALCIFACEAASLFSRIEMNLNIHGFQKALRRWPGGMKTWLTGQTFMSSLFISLFAVMTVKIITYPFLALTYCACFYRYGNGLIERVLEKYVRKPRGEHLAAIAKDDEEDETNEKQRFKMMTFDLQKLRAKDMRRTWRGLEEKVQDFARDIPVEFQVRAEKLPGQVLSESKHFAEALQLVLQQLNRDAIDDAETFQHRLEEVISKIDSSARNLTEDLANLGKGLAEQGHKLKIN